MLEPALSLSRSIGLSLAAAGTDLVGGALLGTHGVLRAHQHGGFVLVAEHQVDARQKTQHVRAQTPHQLERGQVHAHLGRVHLETSE